MLLGKQKNRAAVKTDMRQPLLHFHPPAIFVAVELAGLLSCRGFVCAVAKRLGCAEPALADPSALATNLDFQRPCTLAYYYPCHIYRTSDKIESYGSTPL